MKVKAKVSFCGVLSMAKGQEAEIPESEELSDLLAAGYVEEIKDGAKSTGKAKKDKKEAVT